MRIQSRDCVLIVGCLGVLLLFGLIGLQAQTVNDSALQAGLTALDAGDLETSEARFQEILAAPAAHGEEATDLAQLGLLRIHRERDDLAAFETELQALEARNPTSPVIDDAVYLYAQFAFDRGEYHFAASIAELFLEDPVLAASEYGEDAAILAIRGMLQCQDSGQFEQRVSEFSSLFPRSEQMAFVELMHAELALDVLKTPAIARNRFEAHIAEHPEGSLRAEATLGLARAQAEMRQWDAMFENLGAVANDLGNSNPSEAAEALEEMAFWELLLNGDEQQARTLLGRAESDFGETEGARRASRWLQAMDSPRSLDGLDFQMELGQRAWDTWGYAAAAFQAYGSAASAAGGDDFQELMADESVSEDTKARALYRIAYSEYQIGNLPEAVEHADQVIDTYPATYQGRVLAPSLLGMIDQRGNRFAEAREIYREIARNLQAGDEDIADVYENILRTSIVLRDNPAAIEACTELLVRFPDAPGASRIADRMALMLEIDPRLEDASESALQNMFAQFPPERERIITATDLRELLFASVRGDETGAAPTVAESPPIEEGPIAELAPETAALVPGGAVEVVR